MTLRKMTRKVNAMRIAVPDIRPVSQVGRNFGAVTDEVEAGRSILVMKNNKPVAAVVPPEMLEQLDAISEREDDIALLVLSLIRVTTNHRPMHTLEDVAAEFGVSLDDLDDEVVDDD
ncbi:MAG: type II toxin-antitoxin system Phd/YefM family antitoxin [Cellulomonadaceae bacterium]|jgi:prevent-host-death family protein|nr:type II toxin-antitoxin system Phd/YefM family antitoxin [Cellulomonadaceae bacterium]